MDRPEEKENGKLWKREYDHLLDFVDLTLLSLEGKSRKADHPEAKLDDTTKVIPVQVETVDGFRVTRSRAVKIKGCRGVETRPETPGRVDVTALRRRMDELEEKGYFCQCASCTAENTRFSHWMQYMEKVAHMCRNTDIKTHRPAPWDIWWREIFGPEAVYVVEIDAPDGGIVDDDTSF